MAGRVLVTGAAGFIGSHVVKELLSRGREVRATARAPENAGFLLELPMAEGASLNIVKMDLLDAKSVESAVSGCVDVIHCAAALYVGAKNPQTEVVDPSIIGTGNLIAAINSAGGVERIVHTSSVAAIRSTYFADGQSFDNADWCEDATLKSNAYGLAKAGAERLIREWWGEQTSEQRPRLVTVHPSIVIGPIMAKRHLSGSMGYVDHLLKGKPPFVLKSHINMVDVRDVASAHVDGLLKGVDGGRYILHAGSLWQREMCEILRKGIEGRRWPRRQLPKSLTYIISIFHPMISPGWVKKNIGTVCHYDVGDVSQALDFTFRPVEESILEGALSVIEHGWR